MYKANPPKEEHSMMTGAAVGAGAGAIAGELVSSGGDGLLFGAGVGALAGGLVGYHYHHTNSTREQMLQYGIDYSRYGDRMLFIIPADKAIKDQNQIRPSYYEALNAVAYLIEQEKITWVDVSAYTGETESKKDAVNTTTDWAQAVAKYLWYTGVDARLMTTTGKGATDFVAHFAENRDDRKNRRIQILVYVNHDPII